MISELTKLKDAGYIKLIIRYSGSGDSGDIDEILTEDAGGNEEYIIEMDNIDREAISDYCYSNLLENIEDWCNNDGGYGEIHVDLDTLEYSISNNIRVYDIESYEHSGTIENKL